MKRRLTIVLSVALAAVLALSCWGCAPKVDVAEEAATGRPPDSTATVPTSGNTALPPSSLYEGEFSESYELWGDFNTEEYSALTENGFLSVATNPTSTFSSSVDTASYANLRRMINSGYDLKSIPSGAIRTEEFLNYFNYDFVKPSDGDAFAISVQIADCPWNKDTRLMIVGLQAQDFETATAAAGVNAELGSNLVFLIDVSGSMNSADKLPLLKESFSYLVDQLNPNDRVSIVTYAGSDRVVLEGVYASEKKTILKALEGLQSGGSTAGAKGLTRAYDIAGKYYIEGGNNRIILASDGDLNVGISSESELHDFVSEKRASGIYLSVLGFGTGNYKDNKMKTVAQYGNGTYYYIDCIEEAIKVFGEDLSATLFSVADDVKVEVEFNPAYIKGYRLIGYESRLMSHEDFTNDKVDAAEVGAGHQVIVAYEIVMADSAFEIGGAPLKYQGQGAGVGSGEGVGAGNGAGVENGEWLTLALRYKDPGATESKLRERAVGKAAYVSEPNEDWIFASAVIEFCMVVSQSDYVGTATLQGAIERAQAGEKSDPYRTEFISLAQKLAYRD